MSWRSPRGRARCRRPAGRARHTPPAPPCRGRPTPPMASCCPTGRCRPSSAGRARGTRSAPARARSRQNGAARRSGSGTLEAPRWTSGLCASRRCGGRPHEKNRSPIPAEREIAHGLETPGLGCPPFSHWRSSPMNRRDLLLLLASAAAARPLAAQTPPIAVPVIGFLSSGSAEGFATLTPPFLEGLKEAGYREAENVPIEYAWAAGQQSGRALRIIKAGGEREIDAALAEAAQRPGTALIVATDPYFFTRREQIAGFTARQKLPAIFYHRGFVAAGGLMSHGATIT